MAGAETPIQGRASRIRNWFTPEARAVRAATRYEKYQAELKALDEKRESAIVSGVAAYIDALPDEFSDYQTRFELTIADKPYFAERILEVPPGHNERQTRGYRFFDPAYPNEPVAEELAIWEGKGPAKQTGNTYMLTKDGLRMTAAVKYKNHTPNPTFEISDRRGNWFPLDPQRNSRRIDRVLGTK